MTKRFDQLGLPKAALSAVEALGYDSPTPVQEQAIPTILDGHDVIAAAKTGTGKTAAFSLPSLARLGHASRGQGPLMLVVTPTRELALQIEKVCRTIADKTHHHVACIVGGVSYGPQEKALKRGCDVLIATPGRLLDHMQRGTVRLNQAETLVLDEADRMLDMGFLPDMRKIVAATPSKRQTLLFSATIDSSITDNMGQLLHEPVFIEIAHKGETADRVEQYQIRVDQRNKVALLTSLLEEKGGTRVIVFARTRHRADTTCRKLRQAGYKAEPIHSDRSQNQRKHALDDFANGKTDIIVATDVLARGIDISDVNYVVNFDLPNEPEAYVHRIGRTGRANAEGFAVSFITPEDKKNLKAIERLIGQKIPSMELKSYDDEKAAVIRANNEAALKDPELAQAVKEQNRSKVRKAKAAAGKEQPIKTRGTAKKQDKKNQKSVPVKANRSYGDKGKGKNGAEKDGKWSGDMRPGRAARAQQTRQPARSGR